MTAGAPDARRGAPKVLLIDDKSDLLANLARVVREMAGDTIKVTTWVPTDDLSSTGNPLPRLEELVDDSTVLVATDEDLTSSLRGFFGSAVANWCKARLIPVANFSRALTKEALVEPGLFEFRLGRKSDEAGAEIVALASGFIEIENALLARLGANDLGGTPAEALAEILGGRSDESDFAPYLTRVGAANGALLTSLNKTSVDPQEEAPRKIRILAYMLGHVLRNGILRYPGPILSIESLCAYCATGAADGDAIAEVFESARYDGPFANTGRFYWRRLVDDVLVAR